jgi:hypothetical protein
MYKVVIRRPEVIKGKKICEIVALDMADDGAKHVMQVCEGNFTKYDAEVYEIKDGEKIETSFSNMVRLFANANREFLGEYDFHLR